MVFGFWYFVLADVPPRTTIYPQPTATIITVGRPLQDPMTILLGCTVWVPLLLWISALVGWTIANEIEVVSGILGIAVGFALGICCLHPPTPILQPIAYATVWLTLPIFPIARAAMNRRELRGVDVHALERAYDALGQRPREVLARFRVASASWTLGMTGHAIRIAEGCLAEMDPKLFAEEHMIVRRWHREGPSAEAFVDYVCMDCGGACPPGKTHCPTCGAPFLLDRVRGRAFGGALGRKLVAAWIAGAGALAGVVWALTLPPAAAIGAIVAVLGLAFLVVFLAFRPRGEANA